MISRTSSSDPEKIGIENLTAIAAVDAFLERFVFHGQMGIDPFELGMFAFNFLEAFDSGSPHDSIPAKPLIEISPTSRENYNLIKKI